MIRRLSIVLTLFAGSSVGLADDAMPLKLVSRVKEATVFVRTTDARGDGPSGSGSGFLVGLEGKSAFIVTNDHVVHPQGQAATRGGPKVEVIFRSGTRGEARATAEVVAADPVRDLAVLAVAGVDGLPSPIEVDPRIEPHETMPVYIFGFPFGENLAEGGGNPPVNVARGQVSSLRRGPDDRLASVLLDGALNPGNSGGPVVDPRGRLVGVARATIRGANIGFAVAVPGLLEVLDGRALEISPRVRTAGEGVAEVRVEVSLIDPLRQVTAGQLLRARGAPKSSKPPDRNPERRPNPKRLEVDGRPGSGPLEGAERLALAIEGGRASARFEVPSVADLSLWCQVGLTAASGRESLGEPGRHLFVASKRSGLAYWGEVIDPDADSEVEVRGGGLEVEVPGTLHDLNIDIDRLNAPRVVQAVEGDFRATVRVAGSFRPGESRTGPKSVPYNGGGLLLWQGPGDYLRLERGAMYRGGRVVGLVAFESREGGTRADVHNKGGLDPSVDLWLRIDRRGGTIFASDSDDDTRWVDLQPIEVDWPGRLKVGLAAVNSCGDPMSVRFESLAIEALEAPR